MSLKKILLVVITFLVVYGGLALPCQAQNALNRRRPLRWLGQGYSDGYHRHNPGHDTSYYNPYTAHNSTLVSQSPEYQAILAQQASQQPTQRFFAGVPFSVYAAPNQLTPGLHNLPGQQVQGTFSPSVGSGLSDSDEGDFGDADNNDVRNDDNDIRNDDNDVRNDDNDDNDFREDNDDALMDEKEPMKDMKLQRDVEEVEDGNVETSDNLGGLSGLDDSLSFDFD